MHGALAAALMFALCAGGGQAQHVWTFAELTAKADLVVIASHISTQDTARRRALPEVKSDMRAAELRTDLKVLQVLKGAPTPPIAAGATLTVRHYSLLDQGPVTIGSALKFVEPARVYLLFLTRQPDGVYEPVSGHIFPADSVYLLDRSDRFPPPLPPSLPNMSGTWVLVNGPDAPAGAAREVHVTQSDTSFEVTATGGSLPASRGYALGLEGGTVSGNGDRTVQSAIVRNDSLVIETASYPATSTSAGGSIWRSEVWSVAGDRLTIHVKERRADQPVLDATLVYRRR